MNMTLYISGKAVDLDASSLILYNYTRDEASNPTIVKNSYSQKVTIPATPANNAIFSHYYRSDFRAASGFNPIAKTPFEIRNERNEILESGYIKMESVERKGANVVNYSVSLLGGLGGFFYALKYNDDGSEKTLADLKYYANGSYVLPNTIGKPITAASVKANWQAIDYADGMGDYDTAGRLITFAPTSQMTPSCKFDADKAVYKSGAGQYEKYAELYTSADGYYPASTANGSILLEMANKHDEWEMQDLRCYLQRPAISVYGLIHTIANANNTGDYTLVLDEAFFTPDSTNRYCYYAWMTLPMFDRDNLTPADATLADLLKGTMSPADFLIGYAKRMGLVFAYETATKTIKLLARTTFYNNTTPIDIDGRIDRNSVTISPTNIDKRWYIFQDTMVQAEFTEKYLDTYGKEYGSQWVDTNYQFNDEQNNLLDKAPFKGVADVREKKPAYILYDDPASQLQRRPMYFKFSWLEEVKWKLYNNGEEKSFTPATSGRKHEMESFNYTQGGEPGVYFGTDYFYNFLSLPQTHDKEGKALDGSGILLFYDKSILTPDYLQTIDVEGEVIVNKVIVPYFLTDDTQEMLCLNEGTPCWSATLAPGTGVVAVNFIPSFRRWSFDEDGDMYQSMDFGNVKETQVPEEFVPDCGIYAKYWQKYIEDRCNVDTRVLTCKVDLSGMKVDASLLRRFFAFDGAVWSLNKIINHCMTKAALTQCEFIKVQDITNYTTQ